MKAEVEIELHLFDLGNTNWFSFWKLSANISGLISGGNTILTLEGEILRDTFESMNILFTGRVHSSILLSPRFLPYCEIGTWLGVFWMKGKLIWCYHFYSEQFHTLHLEYSMSIESITTFKIFYSIDVGSEFLKQKNYKWMLFFPLEKVIF